MRSEVVVLIIALAACGPSETSTNANLCTQLAAGDLVLTELMLDPDGADVGSEYLELSNVSGTSTELAGLTVYAKTGTTQKSHIIKAGTVPGHGYFTLGDVRSGPNPEWIGYSYGDSLGSLSQTTGTVGLRCGTTVIDEVSYTRGAKSGRARMLGGVPDALRNDDEAAWCDAPVTSRYSGNNAGTPGAPNPPCQAEVLAGTCVADDVTRALQPPKPGRLLITEVMPSPRATADATGEWFEVHALDDLDLNGLTVLTAGSHSLLNAPQCLHLTAGDYAVVARSTDAFLDGDLPPPVATYGASLTGTNERLTLRLGDAGIDEVTLPSSSSGIAWQVERSDGGARLCLATGPWRADGGGDWGSPGEPNPPCQTPRSLGTDAGVDAGLPANTCLDALTGLPRSIASPAFGDLVITEVMADPSAVSDPVGEWFEVLVKAPVDLNGLTLANEGTGATTLTQAGCLHVPAWTYALFSRSALPATNGYLPTVLATFDFDLANSTSTTHPVRAVRVLHGNVELDRLSYTSATPGAALQLGAGFWAVGDNDTSAHLCTSTQRYAASRLPDGGLSGDRGTPGLPDLSCP
jgi:hypothetical protein